MRKWCFAEVALVAVLSVAACDTDSNRASSAPGEGGGATGAANPPNPSSPGMAVAGDTQLNTEQQTFVRRAAHRMGQDKAQNQRVKELRASSRRIIPRRSRISASSAPGRT